MMIVENNHRSALLGSTAWKNVVQFVRTYEIITHIYVNITYIYVKRNNIILLFNVDRLST
jgi:hypothetical protein